MSDEELDDDDLDTDEDADAEDNDQIRHDNAKFAELLGIPEMVLIEQIGGPWYQLDFRDFEGSITEPLFIGRAGNSALVAIDLGTEQLTVGQAIGTWHGPGTLLFHVEEPKAVVPMIGAWLEQLATTVDAACEAKRDSLTICRFCGEVVGPEMAFGEECCSGCASTYLGIIF